MWNLDPSLLQRDQFGNSLPPSMPAPVAPTPDVQQPQPAPTQAAQPAPHPTFAPATVTMPPPGPAESVMTQALNNQPRPEDYQMSTGQKIWHAIAAGLAGASQGAQAGVKVGQELDPYNIAQQRWRERMSALQPQVDMEQHRAQRGLEMAKLGTEQGKITTEADQAATESQRKVAADEERGRHNIADEKNAASNAAARWAQANKLTGIAAEIDFAQKNPAAYKTIMEAKHPKESFEDAVKKASGVAEAHAKVNLQYGPQIAGADEAARQKVRNAAPLPDDVQASVDGLVTAAKADPDSALDQLKFVPGGQRGKAAYLAGITEALDGIPKQLDTIQRRVRDAAKTAILHATTLKTMLQDPDIQSRIGPLQGRLATLNQAIGSEVFNKGDEGTKQAMLAQASDGLSPSSKEAKFIDLLKYLVLFEAANVSGTRPSWQLIKYLGTTQGSKFDMDRTVGNLDAAITSAGIRLQGLYSHSKEGIPTSSTAPKATGGFNWDGLKEVKK